MTFNDFFNGIQKQLDHEVPGAVLTVENLDNATPEQLAETIKADIKQLVGLGVIPPDVASFSDLHNFVDANVLGDAEKIYEWFVTESDDDHEHQEKLDKVWAITDPAQGIVDAWIKAGGIVTAAMNDAKIMTGKEWEEFHLNKE